MIEKSFDDLIGVHLLGFGLVADGDPMAQDVESDGLHILWRDITTATKECVRPRCPECGEDTTLPPSNAAPNKARIQNAICSLARSLVRVRAVCMRG